MRLSVRIGCIALIFNNRFQFISYIQFMKVFVTGANGLLGQHLIRQLVDEGKFVIHATGKGPSRLSYGEKNGVTYHQLDITDFKRSQALVEKISPHILIHAAAVTQPNDCAADKTTCWKTNVGATRTLLKAAQKAKSYFIYISSDFVFDGNDGPYDESATPNPINDYGESKLLAEEMVEMSGLHWAIVRTVLLYGGKIPGGRPNFIQWVKDKLTAGETIQVVDDQFRTPTYVEDLAKGILLVLMKHAKGVFHISGREMCTPYQLATTVANLLQLDESLIEKVTAASFAEPAKRPPKTGFIITKAVKELGYVPVKLEDGLKRVFGL
ncbi:SDR family oxidoreductase [Lacibacter sp. H407]|uniref:SDR family oxidoreductase n=1 Tax=Lacibacter sp. H407 TaxID=3133423 RepID=UPI0030BF1C97